MTTKVIFQEIIDFDSKKITLSSSIRWKAKDFAENLRSSGVLLRSVR